MIRRFIKKAAVLGAILIGLLYFLPKNIAIAAESDAEEGQKKLTESVESEVDRLDTDALQEYFDSLSGEEKTFSGDDIKTLIKSLAAGNSEIGFYEVANSALKGFVRSVLGFMPALISIIIIAVLYGMLSNLNSGFLDKSTDRVIYFACYGSALIILINEVVAMINLTTATADKLGKLMSAVFPVMLTVMTALGGGGGAGLIRPLMSVAAVFAVKLIGSFVIPCFVAAIIFTVVGNLSPAVKLNKLSSFFRKLAEWVLGSVFGAYIALLTAKGIIGRTVDGVGVNAAKFAISGYVPILGSYISDGFDVVMAGCILIKNAVGVTGLLLMLGVVISPILKLAAFTLCLKFVSAVIEPLSDGKMSDFTYGVSKSVKLLTASLVGLAFMFFAMVLLVSSSCNLGVI